MVAGTIGVANAGYRNELAAAGDPETVIQITSHKRPLLTEAAAGTPRNSCDIPHRSTSQSKASYAARIW